MDNVRNMTGSPIAGIDPHGFLDVRPLNYGPLRRSTAAPTTLLCGKAEAEEAGVVELVL